MTDLTNTDASAYYTTEHDEHGPYYPIYCFGKMIAYANDLSGAEVVVAALRMANDKALALPDVGPRLAQ
jgi:hypothetical protein